MYPPKTTATLQPTARPHPPARKAKSEDRMINIASTPRKFWQFRNWALRRSANCGEDSKQWIEQQFPNSPRRGCGIC